jgi:hypothetical protein
MSWQLIGGVVGLLVHIPLLYGIWKGTIKQSFATYGLWCVLDSITAYAIYSQEGNFWLAFLYAVGAGATSISLVIKKCFEWGKLESFVLVLVIICIYIKYTNGEFYAMIFGVISLTIASIPQIINTFKRPAESPTGIYVVFCFANLLSLIGAKSFAIEQIIYPGSALILCLIITILSARKSPQTD